MKIPKIIKAWAVPGLGGWYCDDKQAIIRGAQADGYVYQGDPVTPGFRSIREPGEALLVTLLAEDRSIGEGDCVSVTYAGGAGREGPFHIEDHTQLLATQVLPRIVGQEWASFRDASDYLDQLAGRLPLHPAILYGISQALLSLAASEARCTITQVVCDEYGLGLPTRAIRVGMQTGEDRYHGVDKAILKEADILPHGLIKTAHDFGSHGEALISYAQWVKERVRQLGDVDYHPTLHFDLYGSLGRGFDMKIPSMVEYLIALENAVAPYCLQIETPVEMETQAAQIETMATLVSGLKQKNSQVKIIADEWCNTLEDIRRFGDAGACDMVQIKMPDVGNVSHSILAVLLCKEMGLGAYIGGSCNETVLSAQISVDIALATQADQILARPGMGVDEALMVVRNESARVLSRIKGQD